MTLSVGTCLGPYEIRSALGAGGMGEVYRAKDTKLGREVALKILPSAFTSNAERLARFRREAQVLASLNHPHVGAIYGLDEADGQQFLVLELVDGESLDKRIARGAIPVDEALGIAKQIAEALEAAHERGIIHRDLKPANIALTRDDNVKVLDFGLAKATEAGINAAPDLANSPTLTSPAMMTGVGMILGTAAYMSPEQARGKPVDKRADIWAFGCVLFEMLTGRVAFAGATVSDHITAILGRDPDWAALPQSGPPGIHRLLRRCLERDPKRRLHDMADARIELDDALGLSSSAVSATTDAGEADTHGGARLGPRAVVGWAVGTMVVAAAAGVMGWTLATARATRTRSIIKSAIELPPGTRLSDFPAVALSPDGRTVVFAAQSNRLSTRDLAETQSQLYLRATDRLVATPIRGTEGASHPVMSPDGQWVAFSYNDKIKKVALSGGAAQVVCDIMGIVDFAAWGGDNTIVFTPASGSGLWQVSANGGTPQILTTASRDQREKTHRGPEILPGGKAVIMTVGTADITSFDDARIEVLTLATGTRRVLIQGGMNARYVSTGHLIYARAGSLLAVPFDLNRLEVTGPPTTVVEDVFTDPDWGFADFAVSRDGSLLYAPGGAGTSKKAALVWVDRQGRNQSVSEIRTAFDQLQLSPDGQRIAVELNKATAEIWVYDLVRTTFTRLVNGWDNNWPIWSPDGTRVTFRSDRAGAWNLFSQAADGTGTAERLTTNAAASQFPESWSPDGRFLVFSQRDTATGADSDLWVWSVDDRQSRPLMHTPASEKEARISPDGRWLAYISNPSGRSEVYIQAFPGPSRTWQVSLEGGTSPIWAQNGRELLYRNDNQMMAVDISITPVFSAGRPKRLFEGSYLPDALSYDVARDGRFLMINDEPQPVTHLNLVQNWFEELKARVPTK